MLDADIGQVAYVIGVLIFAAIFQNQFSRWRRVRKELKETRAELARLRERNRQNDGPSKGDASAPGQQATISDKPKSASPERVARPGGASHGNS